MTEFLGCLDGFKMIDIQIVHTCLDKLSQIVQEYFFLDGCIMIDNLNKFGQSLRYWV